MQDGFLRAAAASIPVAVADPRRNAAAICARIDQAHRAHAALLVLPELCVTGYTCGDLFLSALLLDAAETALTGICAHTQNCDPVVVLGVPLRAGGKLYNCAAGASSASCRKRGCRTMTCLRKSAASRPRQRTAAPAA